MKALSNIEKRITKLEKFATRISFALNGQPTRRRRRKAKARRKQPQATVSAPHPKKRPAKRVAKKQPSGKRDLRSVPEAE